MMNENELLEKIDQLSLAFDVIRNAMANAALTTLIADQYGSAVLHIDNNDENQLVITVANLTTDTINVDQLSGPASPNNWNITFNLPNNKFYFYTLPTIDKINSTPGNWELVTDSVNGWIRNIYLANTGTCVLQPKGQKGDTLTLVINYGAIVPDDPKALNVPGVIVYQNMETGSGVQIKGPTPQQSLGLMSDEGRPVPLVGSFVGPITVLNDSKSAQTLILRLVNTSADPIQFIVPPKGQPTQSFIEVTFPVSDQVTDQAWSLCESSAWKSVQASLTGSEGGNWNINPDPDPTKAGAFILRPDPNNPKVTGIPPLGTLDITFSGVTSSFPPGIVQVQVSLNRFVLYGTQTFGVMLEKSPLVYNTAGGGMILSAGKLEATNNGLAINGDSSVELVHIQQMGTGTALVVDGGNVLINESLTVNGINSNMGGVICSNSVIDSPPDPKSYPLLVTNNGPGSGLAIGWNKTQGMGETDFYNYGQNGSGGFAFYNNNNCQGNYPNNPDLLLLIDSGGNATVEGELTVNKNLSVAAKTALKEDVTVDGSITVGGSVTAQGPLVSAYASALFSPGNTDGSPDVVFRKDANYAYISPWGTGTANNQVVVGGAVNTDFKVTGNTVCNGTISLGSWTISIDNNNNLCFSTSQGGAVMVNGKQVIADGSPCFIRNEQGTLNGTTTDQPGPHSNAVAYWMDNSNADYDSNLTINYGNPFS